MKENKFWIVNARVQGNDNVWKIYNGKPSLYEISYGSFGFLKDNKYWYSIHDSLTLCGVTFPDIGPDTEPVPVRLVLTDELSRPDLFIQREKDNLYMHWRTETFKHYVRRLKSRWVPWFWNYKEVEVTRVPHDFRISNKLFPEITEESGIVGMDIERITVL